MDTYEAWFDLRDSSRDLEFARSVREYLGHLQETGLIEGYRLARRKLGFGPPELGDFHIRIDVTGLGQLEQAFQRVARRDPEIEKLHAAVFSAVANVRFALYRDFPDPVRIGDAVPRG